MKWETAVLGILGAGGAYLAAISPRMLKRPEQMPRVYYAHRGLHEKRTGAPENTLAAFRRAVQAGYGIELDVQLTKDGKVVVFHDFDLKRACGIDRPVDSYTYEELRNIPIFGSEQSIPLFSDVLKMVRGRVPLIVELKSKGGDSRICEKAAALLDAYEGRFVIESFRPGVLLWYKKNRPQVCRGQLSMNYQKDGDAKGLLHLAARHLLTNFLTRPDFIAYDCRAKEAVSKNLCRILFGCPSVGWTIRSQKELDACRKYYDYFIFEGFAPED